LNGKVWLVGAGPGDSELLTIKGRRLLEQADVVVYDRLIGPGVLGYARPDADLIDVGKRGGCHPVPQEKIEEILIERALEGKRVVRLKGGDPFLFGRGGEEMEALVRRGIACEPVPGVTSALAVPAFAGIPVTHRDYASSLHIVTARRRGGAPIDFNALTLSEGTLAEGTLAEGTLVFLMGASEVRGICRGLVEAGMDKNTPAALIQWGTTARQRRITGVLADLPDRATPPEDVPAIQDPARPPAILVVGRVVALAEALDWRGRLPLSGRRVLVPQVSDRIKKDGRLAELLRSRGAEVLEVRVSRTEAILAPLPPLGGYGWLVFTSAAGVEFFFEGLKRDRRDIREIGAAKIAAVGPATQDAIESRGLRVDLVPSVHSGAALGEALREVGGHTRLLLLRAQNGAPDLPRILRDGGLAFDEVALYRTVPNAFKKGMNLGDISEIDAVAFTCASSVRSLAELWPEASVKAVCIGEQTGRAAIEAGYEVVVAKSATLEDLANAVETLLSPKQNTHP
jgi:uroporphyrinogen III methyltransferase/synthase